ncbi:MAG: hypothetical protein K9K79_06560 [Desulfohalobiaceae bacterium]|nr:hypothetical protein [Desulfohalobiaceae bacterium]
MTQESKISKKKAFTLRLDRETVDEIDALGETRTGKAQELIKIGLAHESGTRDIYKAINRIDRRIDSLEEKMENIKNRFTEMVGIMRSLEDVISEQRGN